MAFGIKRILSFLGGGIYDRAQYWMTGEKSNFGLYVARTLNSCEPWTNHYYPGVLKDIHHLMEIEDYSSTSFLAYVATTEDADPYCVELLQDTIDLASKGREPFSELFLLGEE